MVAAPFKNQSLSLNTLSPSVAEDGFREEKQFAFRLPVLAQGWFK